MYFQVENAVKHCLEFSAARKVPFDLMSDISENVPKSSFGKYISSKLNSVEVQFAQKA